MLPTEFESPILRVVDTRFADPSSNSDGELEGAFKYSRRMEFVCSPQLAQTEITFSVGTEEWQRSALRTSTDIAERTILPTFDYNTLHMAVHRVISRPVEQALRQRVQEAAQSSVAVIGAGCCALPANLLVNFPSSLTVHAVEPAQEVLSIADSHFGMDQFPPERLVRHPVDGAAFLQRYPDARYDAIIIDAFESAPSEELARMGLQLGVAGARPVASEPRVEAQEVEAEEEEEEGDGVPAVLAPPFSLLDHWQQWAHALRPSQDGPPGSPGGLLVINVYGPEAWIDHVRARIEQSGLFCSVRRTEAASPLALQSLERTDSRNIVLSFMLRKDAEHFKKIV